MLMYKLSLIHIFYIVSPTICTTYNTEKKINIGSDVQEIQIPMYLLCLQPYHCLFYAVY